eukprot:scaffold34197_cov70-Phaeocystis_antarctica.AAC.4
MKQRCHDDAMTVNCDVGGALKSFGSTERDSQGASLSGKARRVTAETAIIVRPPSYTYSVLAAHRQARQQRRSGAHLKAVAIAEFDQGTALPRFPRSHQSRPFNP